ncbi:MAG: hypothetical protein V3U78_06730 [Thiotrichaceae bacterium]
MTEYETKNGSKGAARDGSFIPYIVEEIISRSAYQVVFDYKPDNFISLVPSALKERVDWVDTKASSRKAHNYLHPLFEELSVTYEGFGYGSKKENPDSEDHENIHMLMNIVANLEKLFLSIEESLQVDVDLMSLNKSLEQARTIIRSSEGRARVSILQGLMNSYHTVEAPCLIAVPTASEIIVEHFQRLVNDAHYLELSNNANQLGFAEKSKHAIEIMRRKASDLLKNKYFKKGFNQSAKAISLATQVHIPETEVAEPLLSKGYLPPIISLYEPLSKAKKLWEKHSPRFIHPNSEFYKKLEE